MQPRASRGWTELLRTTPTRWPRRRRRWQSTVSRRCLSTRRWRRRTPAAASICVESEFQGRDDGFPGVQKDYGFSLPAASEHLLDTAVVYTELAKGGACNVGEVYTTDGRVASLKLNVVQDDKKFFPIYSPALSVRSEVAKKYPALESLSKPIADKLTTEALIAMNKEVSVDGMKPRAVAEEWMRSQGFIK